MSTKVPIISARQFEKIILGLGFEITRKKGSHVFYRHPDGRYTTLPHHGNQDIGRPLIRQILNQIHLSLEEFSKLCQQF